MGRFALGLSLSVGLAALACSSFASNDEQAATREAGIDDAAPATVSDAGTSDADTDAAFCATESDATACLDFDETSGYPFGPFQPAMAHGTSPTTVTTDFVSPPSSMSVSVTTGPPMSGSASRLTMPVPLTVKTTTLRFNVKLDTVPWLAAPAGPQFTLAEYLCTNNGMLFDGALVNVEPNPDGGAYLVGLSSPNANVPFGAGPKTIQPGVWVMVELDVDWDVGDGTHTATLRIDGEFVASLDPGDCLVRAAPNAGPAPSFVVNIGLGSATEQPASALYDDIVYDIASTH